MQSADEMTEAEAEICKDVFAKQVGQRATPQTAYRFMTEMRDRLNDHGSRDPEGKALGYLFWVVMTAASSGRTRR